MLPCFFSSLRGNNSNVKVEISQQQCHSSGVFQSRKAEVKFKINFLFFSKRLSFKSLLPLSLHENYIPKDFTKKRRIFFLTLIHNSNGISNIFVPVNHFCCLLLFLSAAPFRRHPSSAFIYSYHLHPPCSHQPPPILFFYIHKPPFGSFSCPLSWQLQPQRFFCHHHHCSFS